MTAGHACWSTSAPASCVTARSTALSSFVEFVHSRLHFRGVFFYLRKTKGSAGTTQVDLTRSTCPNLVSFVYQTASTFSPHSPCSNVPVTCPLRAPSDDADGRTPPVWKYSMDSHLRIRHSSSQFAPHILTKFAISNEESEQMKEKVWKKRFLKPRRSRKVYQPPKLAISDAHHSSNVQFDSHAQIAGPSSARPPSSTSSDNSDADNVLLDDNSSRPPSSAGDFLSEADAASSAGPATRPPSSIGSNVDADDAPVASRSPTPHLDGPEFVDSAVVSQVGRRSRKRNLRTLLGDCDCGLQVTEKEIDDGIVIECSVGGCESRYYHITCVELDGKVDNWKCPAHSKARRGRRGGKRQRRA